MSGSVIAVAVQPPEFDNSSKFDLAVEYDAHGQALFGFAINALRDRGLAEDCVQEAFLRAWRSRNSFDAGRASTRTWLFAILRNVIIDAQRSQQRVPHIVPSDEADELPSDDGVDLERLDMVEALARLSDEHREVVVAVHLTGYTYAEVSDRTGVPVSTLRTRVFYALRALRATIEGKEERRA